MSGLSLNLFIPARGGDFIKVIYLNSEGKNKWSDLAHAAIWERIFDVFALLFLGIIGGSIIGFQKLPYLLIICSLMMLLFLLLLNKLNKRYIIIPKSIIFIYRPPTYQKI